MKKVIAFFAGLFAIGEATILNEGGDLLEKSLDDYASKHPNECNQLVAGLYPFIDVAVENAAAKTKTKYDDDAVAEIKKELEAFASKHGFTLPNLDQD
jgi:hypothetical protein